MQATILTPVIMRKPAVRPKKLLLCIPAYNEAENIGDALEKLNELPYSGQFDILVVDDGSTDRTREICENMNVMVISHIFNLGYGAALKTAYRFATENNYDYIIQMDADGQHDPGNIERIYITLTEQDDRSPDIVIGSRFLQGSESFHIPFYKKFIIAIFNFIIKMTTKDKITDPTSGLQGLKRKAFSFYSKFNNFAIDYPDANMIIQMALNGFKIKEIPAIMHPRRSGESMHSGIIKPIKYIVKMSISVLATYIRESANTKKIKRFV